MNIHSSSNHKKEHVIAFSLFVIINIHLSTDFTAMPDGHSERHILRSFIQVMITILPWTT